MNRLFRAVGSRRGPLAALAALTLAVVAGTVALVQLATEAGTSRGWAASLVLLGAVAIPGTAREVAAGQRQEIAVARLRGLRGVGLAARTLAEPTLAVVVGLLAGLAVGAAAVPLLARGWLPGTGVPGGPALGAGAGAAAVALLVAALATLPVLAEPLSVQVAGVSRPARSGVWTRAGQVVLLVAAVVAVQRAWALGGEDVDPGSPDPVVLLAPALLGLAVGQLSVWALDLLARSGRAAGWGRFGWWLAVRSLARRAGGTSVLRLLVAGGVVAALALTAVRSVDNWLDDSAALQVVGARQVLLDETPAQALALTRELDPDGRWLMAGVATTAEERPTERRGYLDLSRFARVVAEGLAAEPVGDPRRLVQTVEGRTTTDDSVEIRFTSSGLPPEVDQGGTRQRTQLRVVVGYLDAEGFPGSEELTVPLGTDLVGERRARIQACERGCRIRSLTVGLRQLVEFDYQGQVFRTVEEVDLDRPLALTFDRLVIGGVDLTQEPWQTAADMDVLADTTYVEQDDAGLVVHLVPYLPPGDRSTLARGVTELEVTGNRTPLPVLVAGAAVSEEDGVGQVKTPGGRSRPADVVGRADQLPLVGTGGILADLPTALDLDDPAGVASQTFVVVADGAPAALLAQVTEGGDGPPLTPDRARDQLVRASGAGQLPGLLALGLAALAVGLLALGAGLGRRRRDEAWTAAAFRLLGVPRAEVARAGWVESLLVAVTGTLATVVGGWVSVALLLEHLPLVDAPVGSARPQLGVHPWPLVLVGLVVGVVAALVGRRARVLPEAATRPASLREGA